MSLGLESLSMSMYATFPPARVMTMGFESWGTRLVCDDAWVQQHNLNDVEIWDSGGVRVGRVVDAICDAIWWPGMMLSRRRNGRDFQDVRLMAEGLEKYIYLPKFEWEK
jgi:hypothetical protein